MSRRIAAAAAVQLAISATGAVAQPAEQNSPAKAAGMAAGADLFLSADGEDSSVVRAGLNLDWDRDGPDKYRGLRLEKARFNPLGQGWRGDERIYLRAADQLGGWKWTAQVGTDGDTALGAAAIHDQSRFRKEVFVEREIVETPRGLDEGIYYSFAGAALDLPASERTVLTLVGGLQEFTGDNVRTHLRANLIHVVKPEWGLSAQLRTRWFKSSEPGEHDYYSPRWYAQLLPVLQVRRFTDSGWRYMAAAGWGAQRDSTSRWRSSRHLNASVTSPAITPGWALTSGFLYSNTPVSTGFTYSYVQFNLGITRAF